MHVFVRPKPALGGFFVARAEGTHSSIEINSKSKRSEVSLENRRAELNQRAQQLALSFYLRKGFVPQDVNEILKATSSLEVLEKYSPNQPRVPAGNPDGGQWTSGGSGNEGADKLNIDRAIGYLNSHAKRTSTGWCARSVRRALQAGGLRLKPPYPSSARNYGPYLEQYGFEAVDPTPPSNYAPRRGNIVVIQPYSQANPHGHIAMFNGSRWVSDFFQGSTDIWPGTRYRQNKPLYEIYRQ